MPDLVDRVLLAVQQIPPGRVASYGDVARVVGTAARQVGRVLALHGTDVPWWRVTNRDGVLVVLPRALGAWASEGIEVRPDGLGCRIAAYRADPHQLEADYADALAERGWLTP